MNATRLIVSLAGIAVFAAAAAPATAQAEWSFNGSVAPGRTLEIKGINGPIRALAATSGQVRVTAHKTARSSNIDDVTFEVLEHAGGVTICAMYPAVRGRPNECVAGSGGRMSVQDNDVSVEWTVHVPSGVHLRATTVNGRVDVGGLSGDVQVSTVNGAINAASSGYVRASTVNGSIDVTMGSNSGNREMAFNTVNGSIRASFARSVNAEVNASTVVGSIDANFPIQVNGRWGPKSATARVGNGGPAMKLATVNGSITLEQR